MSPYPFIAVSRCPGRTWRELEAAVTLDAVATMLESLGRAIASWHGLDRRELQKRLRRRRDDIDDMLDADELSTPRKEPPAYLGRRDDRPRTGVGSWSR